MTEIRVLVGTTDFERSSAFYGDLLGFVIAEHWDGPDGRGTLYRAADGGIIEIFEDSPHHPFEPPAGVKVAIEVSDVDRLYTSLVTGGVEIVDPIGERPWGHRNFEARDPSGLQLVFFSVSDGAAHAAGEP
jgi:catechol 2,3-dioxygenase-like lactoylglutathione lyase family enzyme